MRRVSSIVGSSTMTVRKRRASASSSWMISLYSLSVVAPMMRTSPRASTDLKMFAASAGAPSADPAPIIVWTSSTKRIRLGRSLISRMTFWIAVLEHPAQHGARDHVVHLQVDDLAVAQADGHAIGLELDEPRQSLGDRRLAHARLAEQQHRVGALAVAENLEHLHHLGIAAEERRDLVLARQVIQVGREVLQEGRQLEALLQALLALLVVAHARRQPRHHRLGIDTQLADDGDGNALRLFEDRRKEVGGLDGLAARPARMERRELEEELGGRRDLEVPARGGRHRLHVLFERAQDLVRVQPQILHELTEHIPLDLRVREADVLVRQDRMLPAPGLVERAAEHSLRRLSQVVLRDVELCFFHVRLPSSSREASADCW